MTGSKGIRLRLQVADSPMVLRTVTSIGRFVPKIFFPVLRHRSSGIRSVSSSMLGCTQEGLRRARTRHAAVLGNFQEVEASVNGVDEALERYKQHLIDYTAQHEKRLREVREVIESRSGVLSSLDADAPLTINQLRTIVLRIEAMAMLAKRRSESCVQSDMIDLAKTRDRLEKLRKELLCARGIGQVRVRRAFEGVEATLYKMAAAETEMRLTRILNGHLARQVVELDAVRESLRFEKLEVLSRIKDTKEALHCEIKERARQLGRLRWQFDVARDYRRRVDRITAMDLPVVDLGGR